MMAEVLISEAERIFQGSFYRNFRMKLDSETALATHSFLKVEKTLVEIDEAREVPVDEDFFVMLADRFKNSISAFSDVNHSVIEVDISYYELNHLGAIFLEKAGLSFAPYFLDLNDAFVTAGGTDNLPIRGYFERFLEQK